MDIRDRVVELRKVPANELVEVIEVDIDGRSFWVRPVSVKVLASRNVVAAALAESLGKTLPWAVGFFFGNAELSMELPKRVLAGNYVG